MEVGEDESLVGSVDAGGDLSVVVFAGGVAEAVLAAASAPAVTPCSSSCWSAAAALLFVGDSTVASIVVGWIGLLSCIRTSYSGERGNSAPEGGTTLDSVFPMVPFPQIEELLVANFTDDGQKVVPP